MYFITRNRAAKTVRSLSFDGSYANRTSVTSPSCTPPMLRKRYHENSLDSLIKTVNGSATFALDLDDNDPLSNDKQSPLTSHLSPDDVTEGEEDFHEKTQHQPEVTKTLKEIPCRFISTVDPKTKFDSNQCKVTAVAFTEKGDLLLSDAGNRKVKITDFKGRLKVECVVQDGYGSLKYPCGLCQIKSGEIVVADRDSGNLKVFTSEGRYLTAFGKDLRQPLEVTTNSKGHVIVLDEATREVFIYRSLTDKGVICLHDENDREITFHRPSGLAVARDDMIYVTDSDRNQLVSFDESGRFRYCYHGPEQEKNPRKDVMHKPPRSGNFHHTIQEPRGMTCDRKNFVLMVDKNRLLRVDLRTYKCSVILDFLQTKIDNPAGVATSKNGYFAVRPLAGTAVYIFQYLE